MVDRGEAAFTQADGQRALACGGITNADELRNIIPSLSHSHESLLEAHFCGDTNRLSSRSVIIGVGGWIKKACPTSVTKGSSVFYFSESA